MAGLASGCADNPLRYCPEDPVLRAQMAVFLEKAIQGSDFIPDQAEPAFLDIIGHWAEDWITKLKADGITSGCAVGYFCPED